MARPICLRLFLQLVRLAASRTFCTAGSNKAIKTPMMAMTTSNSMRVKPTLRARAEIMIISPWRTAPLARYYDSVIYYVSVIFGKVPRLTCAVNQDFGLIQCVSQMLRHLGGISSLSASSLAMKILVVEDEKKTAGFLRKGLTEKGFDVDLAGDGEEGLRLARTGNYDLLLLDVMLPERDGWSILSALRSEGQETPVLFVTAKEAVPSRVKGL